MFRMFIWFILVVLMSYCAKNRDAALREKVIKYDGVWAESQEENALFTIKGDTIVNFDHGDRMYYKVTGDTLVIDYGDFLGRHVVLKHTNDSLILRNEDGSITRLYRR